MYRFYNELIIKMIFLKGIDCFKFINSILMENEVLIYYYNLYQNKLMKVNPFLAKAQKQQKIMDKLLNSTPSYCANSKNIFLNKKDTIQSEQENVNQNMVQTSQISYGLVQTMKEIKSLPIPTRVSAPKIKTFPSSKIELAVRIQGIDCKTIQYLQSKKLSDLTKESLKVDLEDTKKMILSKKQLLQKLQNCLQQLYGTIESNNREFLLKIKSCRVKSCGFIFNQKEINRLLQGLMFYKPSKIKSLEILENILENSQWGVQAKTISKSYNLDILKGFYVLKEVYKGQKRIPHYLKGFNVNISKNQYLDERVLIKQAGQFLKADKINLILCYEEYLKESTKPNQKHSFCRTDQQIKILWANIHMLPNQEPQIQEMIFQLFLRYSSINHTEKYVMRDLALMKGVFGNANQNFKSHLIEKRMEEMLDKGEFNQQDCKGHYLDLVLLLTRYVQIDFQAAYGRLQNIKRLSQKWIPFLKLYLNQVQFRQPKVIKMWKAAYIYKLVLFFENKNLLLTEACEHKLLKNIYTNVSIILGLKFLEVIKTKSLQSWCLKFLSRYNEKDLLKIQKEQSPITDTIFKQQFQRGNIIKLFVELIDKVVNSYVDSQDFTTLETQISSGKSLIFTFNENEIIFQSVKFYIKMFFKLPSYQRDIQANIMSLFKKLRGQNINILSSFQYYNKNLLSKVQDEIIIANHLIFIIELTESETKTRLINEWFVLFESRNYTINIYEFSSVFSLMNDSIDVTSNIEIQLQTLLRGINIFKNVMLQVLVNARTIQSIKSVLDLSLILGNVLDWYKFIQKQIPEDILIFFKQIKYEINRLIINPIQFLGSQISGFQITQKLILIHKLLEDQNDTVDQYQFLNKQKCRISDIINKERTHNLYQLYSYISAQLKKQSSYDLINALYSITQIEQSLSKMLIQQNGVDLIRLIIRYSQKPNFLLILKSIKIANSFYHYRFNQTVQIEKANCLINCIQDSMFLWLKGRTFTIPLFRQLFKLLITAKNAIPYQYHIVYLQQAIHNKLLFCLERSEIQSLGAYGSYLLCMFLGRNKNKIQLNNEIQRNQFITEISVFVNIEKIVLQYHFKEGNSQLGEFQMLFIKKIHKIVFECKQQPFINNICLKLMKNIKDQLINFQRLPKMNKFIEKELSALLRYFEMNSEQSNESLKLPIQHLICKDENQFNSVYVNFMKLIENKKDTYQIQFQLTKLMTFFKNNKKYNLKNLSINRCLIYKLLNQREVVFQFFVVLNLLINRLHFTDKIANNVSQIKDILIGLNGEIKQCENIQEIIFSRCVIQLGTKVLRKKILTSFSIAEINQSHIAFLLSKIHQIFFKWSKPENGSQFGLNEFQFSLRYYPKGVSFQKTFTLMNLLQFRQKLQLLVVILQYCRQVNGLISLKDYVLVEAVVQFISFWKENRVEFNSKESQQKVKVLNHILISRKKSGSYLEVIKSQFILKEISAKCEIISRYLYELNFDFNYYEINFFDQLKFLESTPS